MRHILSTAIVAVVVSLLTLTVAGAVAQEPTAEAERTITPSAATGNADRVDGRHAVGFTFKRGARAGKLVATNASGELPSNIVRPYWGLIRNRPSILSDDKISWGEVVGKPAGFADGVDDAGVTAMHVRRLRTDYSVGPGSFSRTVSCPAGSFVVGGGYENPVTSVTILRSYPDDGDTWTVYGVNGYGSNVILTVYATCLRSTPAGAISGSSNY